MIANAEANPCYSVFIVETHQGHFQNIHQMSLSWSNFHPSHGWQTLEMWMLKTSCRYSHVCFGTIYIKHCHLVITLAASYPSLSLFCHVLPSTRFICHIHPVHSVPSSDVEFSVLLVFLLHFLPLFCFFPLCVVCVFKCNYQFFKFLLNRTWHTIMYKSYSTYI